MGKQVKSKKKLIRTVNTNIVPDYKEKLIEPFTYKRELKTSINDEFRRQFSIFTAKIHPNEEIVIFPGSDFAALLRIVCRRGHVDPDVAQATQRKRNEDHGHAHQCRRHLFH